jgi:hypothetical protein
MLASVFSAALLSLFALVGTSAAQTPTTVSVRLVDPLSSENNRAGDQFTATLAEPLIVNGRVVARKDALVTGGVIEAVSSGRLKRPALLTLSLKGVQSRSGRYPVATGDLTVKAGSRARRDVLIIGGASGAGAAIGGASGGGKGAAIGALIGAGVGTAGAYLTGKHEIVLPAETLLTFHVNSVTISQKDLERMQRAGQGTDVPERARDSYQGREPYYGRDPYYGDRGPDVVVLRRDRRDDDDDEDEDDNDQGRRVLLVAPDTDVIFTSGERVLITDWYRSYPSDDLPPGLAKRDRLPPGLEKQLRERGTLPPGLQKRVRPLPYDLERRLRPLPPGYRRGVIGGDVIIMNDHTSVILDVLRGVD